MIFIISAIAKILSLVILYDVISERRFKPLVHWCAVIAIMLGSIGVLWYLYFNDPWLKFFGFFLLSFTPAYLYKGVWLYKTLIIILSYNISIVSETVIIAAAVTITGEAPEVIARRPDFAFFMVVAACIVLVVVCLILTKPFRRFRKQMELPIWEWLILLLVASFTLIESFPAVVALQRVPSIWVTLRVLMLLFINIALVFLLDKLSERYQVKNEKVALQEQIRYNYQSLQAASEAYQAQRQLTHDFDNHLLTTLQLLEQGQSEEALLYVSTLVQGVAKVDAVVSTNNFIADAVLNQKYMQAQEQGIEMQFIINDLSAFPLSTDKLAMVLANLLDNALEACQHCSIEEKKIIKIKLLLEPTLAMISVLNTSLPVSVSGDDIATTKENSEQHGFGLKNIKQILQKNDFDFAIRCENGWFQFTTMKVLSK